MVKAVPARLLHWKCSWRIIPTLYPEEDIYAPIAAKGDWPELIRLERLSNPGVAQENGDRRLLRKGDQLPKGRWAYNVGRPFACPAVSRFSDGRFGIYYSAKDLRTAIFERAFHTERFLTRTQEPAGELSQRVLVADIRGRMRDIRGLKRRLKQIYSPQKYRAAQRLGAELRSRGSDGIVYDSVRLKGGECVAVFKPQAISHCRRERCLQFAWNGRRITHVFRVDEFVRL